MDLPGKGKRINLVCGAGRTRRQGSVGMEAEGGRECGKKHLEMRSMDGGGRQCSGNFLESLTLALVRTPRNGGYPV